MKLLFKALAWLALLAGLYVGAVLVYATLTDFNPPKQLQVIARGEAKATPDSSFTFITWNIGYSGQGDRADFFYDGGKQVRAPREDVEHYKQGIAEFFRSNANTDVFFIQEIDSMADRSQNFNQIDFYGQHLPEHMRAFAMNYNVKFVPMPLHNPMGGVVSGLATYSRLPAIDFERHAFDSQFSWPTRIFFLDRCFLSHRTPLENGKELVAINTHCSAYDTSGTLVAGEIERIMAFAQAEYDKGNYVVIGGDWNQCPPNYTPINSDGDYNEFVLSDAQLPDGFKWVADPSTPTNRKLETVYSENSYTSVIDHFVVSPNLEVVEVKTVDQKFAWSDHQPVRLTVRIRSSAEGENLTQIP